MNGASSPINADIFVGTAASESFFPADDQTEAFARSLAAAAAN